MKLVYALFAVLSFSIVSTAEELETIKVTTAKPGFLTSAVLYNRADKVGYITCGAPGGPVFTYPVVASLGDLSKGAKDLRMSESECHEKVNELIYKLDKGHTAEIVINHLTSRVQKISISLF